MSLLKKWKLVLVSLSVALLAACAGSSGGSGDYDDGEGGSASGGKAVKKEVIDENKLKKAEDEAMGLTEENHKLRKEIFDAKNKLGIPVEKATE